MIKDYLVIYETSVSNPVYDGSIFEREVTTTIHEITIKGTSLVDVVNYVDNSLDIEHILEVVEMRE